MLRSQDTIPDNNDPGRLTLLQAVNKCVREHKVSKMVDCKVDLNPVSTQFPRLVTNATVVDKDVERQSAGEVLLGRLLRLFQVVQIQLQEVERESVTLGDLGSSFRVRESLSDVLVELFDGLVGLRFCSASHGDMSAMGN